MGRGWGGVFLTLALLAQGLLPVMLKCRSFEPTNVKKPIKCLAQALLHILTCACSTPHAHIDFTDRAGSATIHVLLLGIVAAGKLLHESGHYKMRDPEMVEMQ